MQNGCEQIEIIGEIYQKFPFPRSSKRARLDSFEAANAVGWKCIYSAIRLFLIDLFSNSESIQNQFFACKIWDLLSSLEVCSRRPNRNAK